jgi:hypothetical protein
MSDHLLKVRAPEIAPLRSGQAVESRLLELVESVTGIRTGGRSIFHGHVTIVRRSRAVGRCMVSACTARHEERSNCGITRMLGRQQTSLQFLAGAVADLGRDVSRAGVRVSKSLTFDLRLTAVRARGGKVFRCQAAIVRRLRPVGCRAVSTYLAGQQEFSNNGIAGILGSQEGFLPFLGAVALTRRDVSRAGSDVP